MGEVPWCGPSTGESLQTSTKATHVTKSVDALVRIHNERFLQVYNV